MSSCVQEHFPDQSMVSLKSCKKCNEQSSNGWQATSNKNKKCRKPQWTMKNIICSLDNKVQETAAHEIKITLAEKKHLPKWHLASN